MPLSFLLDTGLRTTTWAISQTYSGVSYLVYGSPKDPVLEKLDKLQSRIEDLTTNIPQAERDTRFYWLTRDKYPQRSWVIISNEHLIDHTPSKSQALRIIADHIESNQHDTNLQNCTLIQEGAENNTYYL
jgi:hypothetical protein